MASAISEVFPISPASAAASSDPSIALLTGFIQTQRLLFSTAWLAPPTCNWIHPKAQACPRYHHPRTASNSTCYSPAAPVTNPTDRIHNMLSRPLDWERTLHLIDYHRVVPQAYGALSPFSHLIPARALDALRSLYRDSARKALCFAAELVRIVGHLESAGIRSSALQRASSRADSLRRNHATSIQ